MKKNVSGNIVWKQRKAGGLIARTYLKTAEVKLKTWKREQKEESRKRIRINNGEKEKRKEKSGSKIKPFFFFFSSVGPLPLTDVTLCGWRDIKIQDLQPPSFVPLVIINCCRWCHHYRSVEMNSSWLIAGDEVMMSSLPIAGNELVKLIAADEVTLVDCWGSVQINPS